MSNETATATATATATESNLSKQEFYKQWLIVLDICNKQPLNETSKFYYDQLKHLTTDRYTKAINYVMRNKNYPNLPMIGEILRYDTMNNEDDTYNYFDTEK